MAELIKAGNVPNGQTLEAQATINDGETVAINVFKGNDSSSAQASCKLIWDYGVGKTNEILWVINEGDPLPTTLRRTASGATELAIVLDNGCTSDYDMSAYCEYQVEA